MLVRFSLRHIAAVLSLGVLAACGAPPAQLTPPPVNPDYAAIQDGDYYIPAVDPTILTEENTRQMVAYNGPEPANSIVVDPFARRLYYVMEDGQAMRYAVGVGPEGKAFRGNATINLKREWPSWTPTQNMIRTQPELYAEYAAGLPGGLENPLGARALYLFRNGRDTYYRIHGTIDNRSIGRASSAGCIRLFNQDIIDLYERVKTGTRVKVRTEAESLQYEGKWVEDENGDIHPPGYMLTASADTSVQG
ncbi:L,D-transpeptidase [Falsirhodobacter sp. alg1]|uniref:L,D-transpeptidase n=1 Tax=Falsirhodobacter sp. alg1 TaxID=1472418 RepID=UPI0005ED9AA6